MFQCLNYASIAIQLADKRVLLHRKPIQGDESMLSPWSITMERFIPHGDNPLDVINKVLSNTFGINPYVYSDDVAVMKRFSPVVIKGCRLTIISVKMKTALRFQIGAGHQFMAMQWSDVLSDIMKNSVYNNVATRAKHTFVAVDVAKELQIKGEFD
jgi:hypothetical protein